VLDGNATCDDYDNKICKLRATLVRHVVAATVNKAPLLPLILSGRYAGNATAQQPDSSSEEVEWHREIACAFGTRGSAGSHIAPGDLTNWGLGETFSLHGEKRRCGSGSSLTR